MTEYCWKGPTSQNHPSIHNNFKEEDCPFIEEKQNLHYFPALQWSRLQIITGKVDLCYLYFGYLE